MLYAEADVCKGGDGCLRKKKLRFLSCSFLVAYAIQNLSILCMVTAPDDKGLLRYML